MRIFACIFGTLALLLCAGCGRFEPSEEDLVKTFHDNRALFEEASAAIIARPFDRVEFDDKGRMTPSLYSRPTRKQADLLKAIWEKTKVQTVFADSHGVSFDIWNIGIVGSGRSKGISYYVSGDDKLKIVPSIDEFEDRSEGVHDSVAQRLDDHWYLTLDQ